VWYLSLLILSLAPSLDSIQVTIDSSEAEAVLEILDTRFNDAVVTQEDWDRLFATDGYRRLKLREESMKRAFTDAEFMDFVLSADLLEQRDDLRETLAGWSAVDPRSSAERVLGYLPEGARIQATIFPMIKPLSNSFVFELKTDPAIFFFLDPKQPADEFENTLAHELHHVGFATACNGSAEPEASDQRVAAARRWIGAFGEGIAMLAAAGGHETHPHAASSSEDRERWDRDVDNFAEDLRRVEAFFRDILNERFQSPDEVLEVARSFYGIQGPWYTIGWKMAATIESRLGRGALVSVLCSPVGFLKTYNEAAPAGQARWSPSLLQQLGGGGVGMLAE
jgi:hypothetical protein